MRVRSAYVLGLVLLLLITDTLSSGPALLVVVVVVVQCCRNTRKPAFFFPQTPEEKKQPRPPSWWNVSGGPRDACIEFSFLLITSQLFLALPISYDIRAFLTSLLRSSSSSYSLPPSPCPAP